MKKIVLSLVTGAILSANLFADVASNKNDSLGLYNVDLEKNILEEMVASIVHEQTIFDMFNKYVLKTGDLDVKSKLTNPANDTNGNGLTFYDWYSIIENSNNNFLSPYNHNGMIDMEYDNFAFTIKNSFMKAKNYAYDRYVNELKTRNIKYDFYTDINGDELSLVKYKLPLKTIKFLYKYNEIIAQGLLILNENEIMSDAIVSAKLSAASKTESDIYVPDGEGGFVMYHSKISATPMTEYKGIVKTFDGVIVQGSSDDAVLQQRLNDKLPKIKGSIGNVIMDIKDEYGNWIKSAIIEYIYDGTSWKKRYSTVNRESYVTTSAKDYYDLDMSLVGNNNINIKNVNMFESTFVGGLYNTGNIDHENPRVLEDSLDTYGIGNQWKEVYFKPVSNWQYNFQNIYAKSYIYSNVNLDQVGGSAEQLELVAENIEPGYTFMADTEACNTWDGYVYDSTIDKCVKSINSCSSGSLVNEWWKTGYKNCKAWGGSGAVCEHATNSNYSWNSAWAGKCSDEKTNQWLKDNCSNPYTVDSNNKVIKSNGQWCNIWDSGVQYVYYKIGNKEWGVINNKDACYNYRNKPGMWSDASGCYWTPETTQISQNPSCSGDNIRVGGKCRDIKSNDGSNASINNAECDATSTVATNKFADLIDNYFFQNNGDKNQYAFGPLTHTNNEITITDTRTGRSYKVCKSIEYKQKAYKKYYVYPSFDIEIKDINIQGKHETITPGAQYVYREILINECDWLGNNCQAIFDKNDLRNGMNNEQQVPYKYGEIFNKTKKMGFNTVTNYFELRKNHFSNTQLLPYSTFSNIDNNLNEVTNSINNRTVKTKALQFEIKNTTLKRLEATSGEVVQ